MEEQEPGGDAGGLLAGIRVLDLTVWRPGPYATQLLAEIGADVVKVEPPGGDPMRSYPGLFLSLNANKRSVMLDLKVESGRGRALELAADADVVIEGFRPGVAARLGVGYEDVRAVNPSIVYCSISGMGQDGPLALASGHDLNYQAWAGSLAPEGGPPVVSPVPIADLAGGMAAAFGICAAVIRRLGSGEGERIDVAMTDVLVTWTGAARARAASVEGPIRGVPGYGTFETADRRHVALGVLTEDHFWRSLCDTLGMGDCRDLGFAERLPRQPELQERIAAVISDRTRDAVVEDLLAAGVPVSPVLDRSEMLGVPHFRERSVVTTDPWSDPATGYPVMFRRHPAERTTPPPALDGHRGGGFRPR
jgi:crotonobetainyl-CoA:carnitine CoA-transferase CaiB-like acyl-CoA transferase